MKNEIQEDEKNYHLALQKIWDLMQSDPESNSKEGIELDMLATLVEAYEAIHFPMETLSKNVIQD